MCNAEFAKMHFIMSGLPGAESEQMTPQVEGKVTKSGAQKPSPQKSARKSAKKAGKRKAGKK